MFAQLENPRDVNLTLLAVLCHDIRPIHSVVKGDFAPIEEWKQGFVPACVELLHAGVEQSLHPRGARMQTVRVVCRYRVTAH